MNINSNCILTSEIVEALENIPKTYEPFPIAITYKRTFTRLTNGGSIGLIEAKWPAKYSSRIGYNLVYIARANIINQIASIFQELKYRKIFSPNIPNYIQPKIFLNDMAMSALLFTWPKSHPARNNALNSKLMADSFLSMPINLRMIQKGIEAILEMLGQWEVQTSPVIRSYPFVELFEKLPPIKTIEKFSPVPLNTPKINFNLESISSLSNPLTILTQSNLRNDIVLHTDIGRINGDLTLDNLLIPSTGAPIVLDWGYFLNDGPLWVDYAKLELDLLLHLVPTSDPLIWKHEWPFLSAALRRLPLEPSEAIGRLIPSALAMIAPIREIVEKRKDRGSIDAFWLSAVYAGIDIIASPFQTSTNRLAAALYAAIALEEAQKTIDFQLPDSLPSVISWPGLRAWRTMLPETNTSIGYALLFGAGKFANDGRIEQLPQVITDLEEFADFLAQHGYQVYKLYDKDFTVNRLYSILRTLKKDIDYTKKPLITCFCGHGIYQKDDYFLLTGDATVDTIEKDAMRIEDFIEQISSLKTSRILMLINSCYSGQTLSMPYDITTISDGELAVITSASHQEESYMLRDDPYSLFMGTVLEALATAKSQNTSAKLFDFLAYIIQNVPLKAGKIGKSQHPAFILRGVKDNFELL